MADPLTPEVGALLGIVPGASSIPTESAIDGWLLDGAKRILTIVPIDLLAEHLTEVVLIDHIPTEFAGLTAWTQPTDMMMLYSATLYKETDDKQYRLRIVTPDVGDNVFRNGSMTFAGTDKVIWLADGRFYVNTNYNANDKLKIRYVKEPTSTDSLPIKYRNFAIDYAVFRAKMEAQEPQEAQMAYQKFISELAEVIKKDGYRNFNIKRLTQ